MAPGHNYLLKFSLPSSEIYKTRLFGLLISCMLLYFIIYILKIIINEINIYSAMQTFLSVYSYLYKKSLKIVQFLVLSVEHEQFFPNSKILYLYSCFNHRGIIFKKKKNTVVTNTLISKFLCPTDTSEKTKNSLLNRRTSKK